MLTDWPSTRLLTGCLRSWLRFLDNLVKRQTCFGRVIEIGTAQVVAALLPCRDRPRLCRPCRCTPWHVPSTWGAEPFC